MTGLIFTIDAIAILVLSIIAGTAGDGAARRGGRR